MPTSIRLDFPGCSLVPNSIRPNRRMRTRMSGGVAGESGRPLPLCRLLEGGRDMLRFNMRLNLAIHLPLRWIAALFYLFR